jgi:mannose-1-phosphate guanylyltransferase
VAGYPIIFHHLSALRKVPSIKEVLLIGFYEESVFKDFIKDASVQFPQWTIKYLPLGLRLTRYLREYQALGTAGGLYLFRDAILKGDPKTIIVMHADVCCSFPLEEMLKMHIEKQAIGTMLGTKVSPVLNLVNEISPEAATNYGCIVSDPQTHEVLHYVEKPSSYISSTINCGVYLFDTSLFGFIRDVMNKVPNLGIG